MAEGYTRAARAISGSASARPGRPAPT
jgi:hypothetical protein